MAFYSSFASSSVTPAGRWLVDKKLETILKLLSKRMTLKNKRVLEIGPGRGLLAQKLRTYTKNMTLIEPSEQLRKALKDTGFKDIKNYFVPPIKEDNASFDAIFILNVFEHMHGPEQALKLMQEMRRVLKKGGFLIMNTPDVTFWQTQFWNGDYTHNYVTTRRRLEQQFIDNRFTICESMLCSGPFFGWWTPFLNYIMKALWFSDLLNEGSLKTKLDKIRFTFLSDVLLIAQKA